MRWGWPTLAAMAFVVVVAWGWGGRRSQPRDSGGAGRSPAAATAAPGSGVVGRRRVALALLALSAVATTAVAGLGSAYSVFTDSDTASGTVKAAAVIPTPTPTTFIERSTASDCNPATGSNNGKLLTSTATAVTMSKTVGANQTDDVTFAFTTDAGKVNLTTWAGGTYTVELNVTAAGAGVTGYKAQLLRVSSTCSTPTTLATSTAQSGTGMKTFTLTSVAASSGTISDRFQVRILVSTGTGFTGPQRTITIQVNDTDSEVKVPWTAAGP